MRIDMELGSRSYPILVERGCLNRLGSLANLQRNILVVTDTGVPKPLVEAALAQMPETERREAVEYIFHQPLEHKRNPTVYWMFVAVHGVVMPYLKDLTGEEARDLQWWYERSYPRREQTPIQRRVVALLKKMR